MLPKMGRTSLVLTGPPLRILCTASHSHIRSDGYGCCARHHLLIALRLLSDSVYWCWHWNGDLAQYFWCPVAAQNSIYLFGTDVRKRFGPDEPDEMKLIYFILLEKRGTNEWMWLCWFQKDVIGHPLLNYFLNCNVVHPVLRSTLNPFRISSFSALFFIGSSLFSPDSISSLSSLHIPSSLPSRFLSRSNSVHLCVHTPGCCGNGGRPHKWVDEQKTWRPLSTEMEREKEREMENEILYAYLYF